MGNWNTQPAAALVDTHQLKLPLPPPTPEGTDHIGEAADDWRLDDRTREAGRRGIATARAILAGHARSDSATSDRAISGAPTSNSTQIRARRAA